MLTDKASYVPFKGFYDLTAFDIPKSEFIKLAGIQKFLYKAEQDRRAGKYEFMQNELDKVKKLSAEYQQVLFSYPIIKPELI